MVENVESPLQSVCPRCGKASITMTDAGLRCSACGFEQAFAQAK